MTHWFRFYGDALNDPKIIKLSDQLYRAWSGLLCIASKNNGVLPPVEDIAIMLRVTVSHAEEMVSELIARELIDKDKRGTMTPHNWRKRQYKSDVSTARVKQFRKRFRNVAETPPEQSRTETDTETEQIQKDDDLDDAREVAAKPPLISSEALKLSAEIAKVCGHDPDFVPPEWYGAPYRVQAWLNDAWPPELVLASVREQVAKKRDGPPSRVDYFEKGIAAALARANTPLPTVKIIEGQTTEIRRETTGSVIAAADRLVARLAEFDRPAPDFSRASELRGGTGAPAIRLVSEG